eukprot:TRINITY_DN35070_c0_g1_i1.p1 TRINITY_DN35070_c0_g1~~TRINITY_DN35070_c0_g1_i1.p1  ORF type:complete len:294 (+),score=53.43 TRINITY_DN35070_c0_g1_i1:165-1046(+)
MPQQVQLAVSRIGGIPGANAYHTSVLVDGIEYSFSASAGISRCRGALSHAVFPVAPRTYDLGHTQRTGRQLMEIMAPYFTVGSYDLLRKNCNSFSDCSLFFLLGRRLRAEYRSLEKFGASMPALVQTVSGGRYALNPEAADFDVEALIEGLEAAQLASKADIDGPPMQKDEASGMWGGASDAIWGAWQKLWEGSVAPIAGQCGSEESRRARMLAEDERLARQLQAEEEDLCRDNEQAQSDEALARKLQAEEDALVEERSSTPRTRSGLPALSPMIGRGLVVSPGRARSARNSA